MRSDGFRFLETSCVRDENPTQYFFWSYRKLTAIGVPIPDSSMDPSNVVGKQYDRLVHRRRKTAQVAKTRPTLMTRPSNFLTSYCRDEECAWG